MTEKQKRYVDYFIETGDSVAAAIRAGYARSYAHHIQRQPGVKAYLAQRRAGADKTRIAPADEIAEFLTTMIRNGKEDSTRIVAAEMLARRMGYLGATDELRLALRRMRRAYINKDPDFPHDFELRALDDAKRLLGDDWPNELKKMEEESK
jgi:phage terminase small subunit